jgi:hypothetical protein
VSTLFRYRTFNHNTKSELGDCRIFLCPPSLLNDPFDCQLDVDVSDPLTALNSELESAGLTPDIVKYIAGSECGFKKPTEEAYYKAVIRKSFDQVGVACFSRNPASNLMWSHYGDSHRGVCIGYSFPRETSQFLADVEYRDGYPPNHMPCFSGMTCGTDWRNFINTMLLTKSKEWAYEREVRVLLPGKAGGFLDLHPSSLSMVVMGMRMPESDRNELLELLGHQHLAPRLYRAERIKNCFKLVYRPAQMTR